MRGNIGTDLLNSFNKEGFPISQRLILVPLGAAMSQDVDSKQMNQLERYDFARRVVGKFEINNSPEFWGDAIKPLPKSFLSPREDIFYKFMKEDPKANDRLSERLTIRILVSVSAKKIETILNNLNSKYL